MTREEIILSHIKRDGLGLEVGAGCAPVAPKKQGFRVHVLDHCDKKALIEKYRRHEVNIENIEEVDFVGGNSGRIVSYGSKQRRPDCLGREGEKGIRDCARMRASATGDPRRARARAISDCPRMAINTGVIAPTG